jgi:hypothetical protein
LNGFNLKRIQKAEGSGKAEESGGKAANEPIFLRFPLFLRSPPLIYIFHL